MPKLYEKFMNFEELEKREVKIIYRRLFGMMAIGIFLLTLAHCEKGNNGSSDEIMQFCEGEVCEL